ncbi:MAG TPA: ThiF family adenylyltransferase [Chryseosolibacter sp.]
MVKVSRASHWYEEMPGLLKAEEEVLKHGLDFFKFISQVPNQHGFIQYMGEISFDQDKRQIVVIVFPHSYPFSPPEIFPYRAKLNEQGAIEFLGHPADGKKTQSFNRGNQFSPDDRMCLFKDEEVWTPFADGVAMAARQAQRWLSTVHSKEGFTENLIVPENSPVIGHAGQVLYARPNSFPDSFGGDLRLKSFKDNHYCLLEVTAENDKGEVTLLKTFPDATALSSSRSEIINGKWFHIANGDSKKLLGAFQNPILLKNFLETEIGITLDAILPQPETRMKVFIFGFRFGSELEIHFFQLYYWKHGIAVQFQPSYLLPKNLSTDLFSRIDALFDINDLGEKKVLAIGAGAIGSEVLKELAGCGIGHFTVVDSERFDAGNSVRHAGDLNSIGEAKVDLVKKIIQARNPFATVTTVPQDLFRLSPQVIADYIAEHDIILDLTANRLVEEYLHVKAFLQGKTIVQAAVSQGALTGVVLVMTQGTSPCINCLKQADLNSPPQSNASVALLKHAPPEFGACSQPALPGSGIDVREVALQTARVVLQLLMSKSSFYPKATGAQLYWHGPAGSKTGAPFGWDIRNATSDPGCKCCNEEN